mmetsp:Transcript_25650/g.19403  ORF Transcript_25650/g.19403 Transcript_25650/m.19403 type:complete len:204 (+) Transcript_25650:1852-2463(+)
MKTLITDNRLPSFTQQEKVMIKGSYDFLGLNYYTSTYVKYTGVVGRDFQDDGRYSTSETNSKGKEIGPLTGNGWQRECPEGLKQVLTWMDSRYCHPQIYIFETGVSIANEGLDKKGVKDKERVKYYKEHIESAAEAIEAGVDLKGFFVWSAIDNFSWSSGYDVRYGLIYADYDDDISLTIKDSGYWYKEWIASQTMVHSNTTD